MKYTITIKDEMFGRLTGEFFANSQQEAEKECREFYAMELGCYMEDINITEVNEG